MTRREIVAATVDTIAFGLCLVGTLALFVALWAVWP